MIYRDYPEHWVGMAVLMSVFWIALIGVTVWAVARITHPHQRPCDHQHEDHGRQSPEEILDRRFASGEIDADAHASARAHLKDHRR